MPSLINSSYILEESIGNTNCHYEKIFLNVHNEKIILKNSVQEQFFIAENNIVLEPM